MPYGSCFRKRAYCFGALVRWLSLSLSLGLLCEQHGAASSADLGCAIVPHKPNELPLPSFPGADAASSNAAWPCSGKQPAWDKEWTYDSLSKPLACNTLSGEDAEVLLSTEEHWPAECGTEDEMTSTDAGAGLALKEDALRTTVEDCRRACETDADCAVWEFKAGKCYRGVGIRCWQGSGAMSVATSGARLRHGAVRVLMDLNKTGAVINSKYLFNLGRFTRSVGSSASFRVADRCRIWCYSYRKCQFWQVDLQYNCWVETQLASFTVPVPLTTTSVVFGQSIVAGEFIQHFCPPALTAAAAPQVTAAPLQATAAPVAQDDADTSRTMYILGGVLAVLALVAVSVGCFFFLRSKAPARSVSRQEEPAPQQATSYSKMREQGCCDKGHHLKAKTELACKLCNGTGQKPPACLGGAHTQCTNCSGSGSSGVEPCAKCKENTAVRTCPNGCKYFMCKACYDEECPNNPEKEMEKREQNKQGHCGCYC